MYGRMEPNPNATVDLSFLVGASLVQLCFGTSDVQLNFSGPATKISVQSSFDIKPSDGLVDQDDGAEFAQLRPFLNHDVVAASWQEMGTLYLEFDNGKHILIFDDSDLYESYVITHGTTTIVV
jgi:hypothetical protein